MSVHSTPRRCCPVETETQSRTRSPRPRLALRMTLLEHRIRPRPCSYPSAHFERRSTPAAAARRSGGHLQELHFLRRGRCPPQLALAGLAHTRIFEAEAGEGTGDAEVVERKGHFIDMFPVWGTLLANKTGRCPKWPRPK